METISERRAGRPAEDLLKGPGNVCTGLGVTGELNLHSLEQPPLQILGGIAAADSEVATGPRIGITRAADLPLRFWIRGNRYVSKNRS